jgi:hypothetical protein
MPSTTYSAGRVRESCGISYFGSVAPPRQDLCRQRVVGGAKCRRADIH